MNKSTVINQSTALKVQLRSKIQVFVNFLHLLLTIPRLAASVVFYHAG